MPRYSMNNVCLPSGEVIENVMYYKMFDINSKLGGPNVDIVRYDGPHVQLSHINF